MSKKYRLHHIFYNFDTGGAQKRLGDFINDTHDIFEHHITALGGNYDHLKTLPDNIVSIYDISYIKGRVLSNIFAIRKAIASLNPDCVLTHNFASFEAVMANTPKICAHIHNEDGFGIDETHTLKWHRNYLRRIFLSGKTLIVPSKNLQNIATQKWQGMRNDIHYVANGVLPFDNPENVCPFNNYDKFTIGTVSMCRPEKNLRQFIAMLADLKQNNCPVFGVLVGDGAELTELKEYAHTMNLSNQDILFAGYQLLQQMLVIFIIWLVI